MDEDSYSHEDHDLVSSGVEKVIQQLYWLIIFLLIEDKIV